LPLRAGRDVDDLVADELRRCRDFGTDRADQLVIQDAELLERGLVEQIAESGDPVLVILCRRAQHGFGKTSPGESPELERSTELLDAEIERVDLVRVDQDARDSGTSKHRGCGRPRKSSADDRNIRMPHAGFSASSNPFLRREWQINA